MFRLKFFMGLARCCQANYPVCEQVLFYRCFCKAAMKVQAGLFILFSELLCTMYNFYVGFSPVFG